MADFVSIFMTKDSRQIVGEALSIFMADLPPLQKIVSSRSIENEFQFDVF